MNCEDFLPALETGDAAQAEAARRHAATCQRCAGAAAALEKLKKALAQHEPLSVSARAVWEHASQTSMPAFSKRTTWTPALARFITAAAACVVVFILVISRRDTGSDRTAATAPVSPVVVIEHDSAAELSQLVEAVDALDGQLVALSDHAERLEVEREVTLTLNQFKNW